MDSCIQGNREISTSTVMAPARDHRKSFWDVPGTIYSHWISLNEGMCGLQNQEGKRGANIEKLKAISSVAPKITFVVYYLKFLQETMHHYLCRLLCFYQLCFQTQQERQSRSTGQEIISYLACLHYYLTFSFASFLLQKYTTSEGGILQSGKLGNMVVY